MIRTAAILAAGEGSRLRDSAASKPLCPVAGRPLIDHALTGLAAAGMTRAVVVLGYRGDEVVRYLESRTQPLRVDIARSDPKRPNGVSVLAAAPLLDGEDALLVMCDHLVEPRLYARVARAGAGTGLRLGIDRRLGHSWVDPLDVTCVATNQGYEGGDRIIAIGKGLEPHDAYDTGVFAIGPKLIAALRTLDSPSLTEGVRRLVVTGEAGTVDVSDLDWIDVDDAPALAKAEEWRGNLAAA